MSEPLSHDADQFEAELHRQQRQRQRWIRGVGALCFICGLGLGAAALMSHKNNGDSIALVATLGALGAACLIAGAAMWIRSLQRNQRETGDLDTLLNRLIPRIVGGQRADAAETHRRHRRRRPRHGAPR